MLIALDLETTGLDPRKDKIIEIAALRMTPAGEILEEFHTLVQPHTALPPLITHLTGITDEDLKEAPSWNDVAESVREFIGDLPILGHSVQFDVDFLTYSGGLTLEKNTILDTFELAQTLLPKESSYSLEILSEKYQLPHPNKHRAIDDTRVAIELYKFLVQKVQNLNSAHLSTVERVLKTSDWNWKELFLKNLPTSREDTAPPPTAVTRPASAKALKKSALKETLKTHLAEHTSLLIEAPFHDPLDLVEATAEAAEDSGEKILLVTDELEELPGDPRVRHLHHPAHYVCRTQFNTLLHQTNFSAIEARLLTKLLLWGTPEGLKHTTQVGDAEQSVWNRISAYPHLGGSSCADPDCPYLKARRDTHHRPVVIIAPELLLENVVEQGHLLPPRDLLVIDHVESLEATMTWVFTRTFSLDQLTQYVTTEQENTLTILFGLLGLMLEKYAPPDAYRQQLKLTEETRNTREWKQVEAVLEKLKTPPTTENQTPDANFLAKKKTTALLKALRSHPEVLTWIGTRMDGTPMVYSAPLKMSALLKSQVWDAFPSLIAVSGFGTLKGNFQFLKKRLNLAPNLLEITVNDPTPQTQAVKPLLFPHPELLDPNSPKNLNQTTEFLKRWIASLKKEGLPPRAFLLTNSIKASEQLHHKLATTLKEQGIDLLTQGMSGGIGKILQRFQQKPDASVLMGTEKLFEAALFSPAAAHLETLFIHRLPFLPPSHPVQEEEAHRMTERNENVFLEFSLPRATLRLKQFLYDGLRHAPLKTIHLLDSRWGNYNNVFPESVRELVIL